MKALITGITGQDGSYLAELLLAKGYEVHGLVRRASQFNRARIDHLRDGPEAMAGRFHLHYADLSDPTTLRRLLTRIAPNELYHLAGQSHVGLSFEIPESTVHEIANATLSLLEICRDLPEPPRIYHASSSEIFGSPQESPQTVSTWRNPVNPYGCAKGFATDLCRVYREAHGLFVASGIAYNHESPRRGENFVTRKIVNGALSRLSESDSVLTLGNLDSKRDWGYAPEYVEAMWLMLQQEQPADHILATGSLCSVRELVAACYSEIGREIEFSGKGVEEVGRDSESGEILLKTDPRFYRKVESTQLLGDPSDAAEHLGWRAQTIGPEVGRRMVRELRETM